VSRAIEVPRDSVYITRNPHPGAVVRGYYCDFLHSPYWRAVRRQALAVSPRCQDCGQGHHLQVHHTSYGALGTEEEYYGQANLRVLCEVCHTATHGLPPENRPFTGPERLGDYLNRRRRDHGNRAA
jgi:5-methylcytosine-specific restriction endonuclease McrA